MKITTKFNVGDEVYYLSPIKAVNCSLCYGTGSLTVTVGNSEQVQIQVECPKCDDGEIRLEGPPYAHWKLHGPVVIKRVLINITRDRRGFIEYSLGSLYHMYDEKDVFNTREEALEELEPRSDKENPHV